MFGEPFRCSLSEDFNSWEEFEVSMVSYLRNLIEDGRGVAAIEYALIAALIAVAAIAAFTLVGTNLSKTFSTIATKL
jgi:pilus assembly protein Flp/PilA